MAQKNADPNLRQKELLQRRGLDPKNYTVVKELNYCIWLRDRRDGSIKVINKRS